MNNEQSYYARMFATMSGKLSALEGQVQKGMRVLDFGSGPSDDVYEYVRHFEANYYALDNSRQVQMLLEEKGIHCIDLAFLKSTDMKFDIIFMSSVFHELLSYLSRNEVADTMNVVLSRLAEKGKLIMRDWCSPENKTITKLEVIPTKIDEVKIWVKQLSEHAIFLGEVHVEGNIIQASIDDLYNILLHVTWGLQSISRESNESYLVDRTSIKQFILNGNPNIKLVSQRAYYQSDYTNYLSNYFKDVDEFVEQHHICTKQVLVLQKV